MSANLVAIVGVIYLGISISSLMEKRYMMALVFFGYALSNVGFYFDFTKG